MKIIFNINYHTEFGQKLFIVGSIPGLGSGDMSNAVGLSYVDNGSWQVEISVDSKEINKIKYKYLLKDERNNNEFVEWGEWRELKTTDSTFSTIKIFDYWRAFNNPQNALYSAAFVGNLWRRNRSAKKKTGHYNHQFQIYAPRVEKDQAICIAGNEENLGNWNSEKAIIMDDTEYPLWKTEVFLENPDGSVNYKYGIYDKKRKEFIGWEEGNNRVLIHDDSPIDNSLIINTDIQYKYPEGNWRGAGIAIPVFSLRTEKSFGVGEFTDLKEMVDWSVNAGMKLLQILPINDSVANHNWKDSYPYAAISVFGLHPIYLNLPKMGKLKNKSVMDDFVKKGKKLNESADLNYVDVMTLKSSYFKILYDETKQSFFKDAGYKQFFKENKDWLVPYAAFSCLRDRYKSPVFLEWPEFSVYNEKEISQLVDPANEDFDDFGVHYFIQYHLHKQLSEVVEYARNRGVILKGDLPIGIYRDSADAWVEPKLYHMNKQAGAPPDDYSISGQNWRFPTYDWEEMAKDDYTWWRRRLTQMAKYFDAYRIDHILGFFRIWEIPYESVEGLMGIFNPAVPMYKDEIESRGVYFDYNRFCLPYIRHYMIDEVFGEFAGEAVTDYFIKEDGDFYKLKEDFNTQRKVENYFKSLETNSKNDILKFGLYTLIGNVLFLEDKGSQGNAFHPKIAFHQTASYKELDDRTKEILNDIYTHYFYHRQEDFWRDQAMVKLPAITKASDMLVCGEDLGMVPDCVPGVLDDLGILRLNIQRMPKETDSEFGHPDNANYLSVVSPSCHDMSTVRGWWEEDRDRSQRFYQQMLGHIGGAPHFCEPWLSEEFLLQHLYSPAMWAIFPIQDVLGIDETLRWKNPAEERINDPSNPDNLWKYRLHINLEDLNKKKKFSQRVFKMVTSSGRNHV